MMILMRCGRTGVAIALAVAALSACGGGAKAADRLHCHAQPCRDIRFSPLSGGTMLYGDEARPGPEGHPFAKDPTVIRHGGRYLMYYSACAYQKGKCPRGISRERAGWWGSIAESRDLVHWRRIGEIDVSGAPAFVNWVAPCAKKFDGKVHLFAQGIAAKEGNPPPNNVIWHATSDDGIHFVLGKDNPVMVPKNEWSIVRAIDAEVYRVADRMILMFATRESPSGRMQQLGVAWAPYGSDYGAKDWREQSLKGPFFKPELPWEMNCIEAPTVVKRRGIWYMFYAGAYNHERQQIGVAWSEDGVNFKRWRDEPVLPHGLEGSWNAWESGHPGAFEDDDGAVYLFYQGKATLNGDYRLSCLKVDFLD